MVRLAWATDIHLNFLPPEGRRRFYESLLSLSPDAVLVTGDIGESPTFDLLLIEMARAIGRPVYFVLGNHDFYRGSIPEVRARAARLTLQEPLLTYVPAARVVPLTTHTALVGHDGWADARLGDFERSEVLLNDYLLIEELRKWDGDFVLDRNALRAELHRLGDEAAEHFAQVLPLAFENHRRVLALTHPPPFGAVCLHDGVPADDDWLPHFSCHAVGQALQSHLCARPDRHLTVLCGHTHCSGQTQVLRNLEVLAGSAEYGQPMVQQVLELE
jgi:3',5'-cyclic AMP phosphodiesterase CpdA